MASWLCPQPVSTNPQGDLSEAPSRPSCPPMESAHQFDDNAVTATQLVDVLSFAVERCSAGLDAKDLCSLTQPAGRPSWTAGASVSVTIKASKPLAAAFSSWLRTHAGLVSELHVQDSTCEWQPWSPNDKAAQEVGRVLTTGFEECASAAAVPAGAQTPAAPSSNSLRLTSFTSNARLGPAILPCLPAMGTTLTRLALDKCWSCVTAASSAALAQLTSLKELRLRSGTLEWGKYACAALPSLTALTRLDIGRLLSSDAPAFPPSLLELKLDFELGYREELPMLYEDEDGNGEVDVEKEEQLLQAARLLDLSRLPLLRTCDLLLSYSDDQLEGLWVQHTVTMHMAAPHLTRLLLDGNFCDVKGLQQPCVLQRLSLRGCRMPTGRLAQLLTGLQELQGFRFSGREFVDDAPELSNEVPNVETTRQEEAELAAAIASCTQLTTLSITDLGTPPPGSAADPSGGHVLWIQHLQHLHQLKFLEVDLDVSDADAQRLTALTALTYLQTSFWDVPDSFWYTLQQQLTNLEVLNPHMFMWENEW